MSTTVPVIEGTPLATAAEVEALRAEVAMLKQQLAQLVDKGVNSDWRPALAVVQAGYAAMTPEEHELYTEAEQEAREFFGRGSASG